MTFILKDAMNEWRHKDESGAAAELLVPQPVTQPGSQPEASRTTC